jgi:tetratricopeptide (TPR) repeat protein
VEFASTLQINNTSVGAIEPLSIWISPSLYYASLKMVNSKATSQDAFVMPEDTTLATDSIALQTQRAALKYHGRYQNTGAMLDLELAILQYQKSLELMPVESPQYPLLIYQIGDGYYDRYKRTKKVEDLDLAILQYQKTLELTPAGHPDRLDRLHELGLAYHDRYRRVGLVDDLSQTILHYLKAVDVAPANHSSRPLLIYSAGLGYHDMYRLTGVIKELDLAILHYEKALKATPADDPDRQRRSTSLALGYHDKYQSTKAKPYLDQAIFRYQDADELSPSDQPTQSVTSFENHGCADVGEAFKQEWEPDTGGLIQPEIRAVEFASVRAIHDVKEGMMHTDSGYSSKSTPSNPIGIFTSANTDRDDTETVYSKATALSRSSAQAYISELCANIRSEIGHDIDPNSRQIVKDALPMLIKAFAIRVGHDSSTQIHKDIMYFIHMRHR